MILRAHIREIQLLENKASEKAGMRFLMIDDSKLFGKDRGKYIDRFIRLFEADIMPEVVKSANMGIELSKAMKRL